MNESLFERLTKPLHPWRCLKCGEIYAGYADGDKFAERWRMKHRRECWGLS